MSATVKLRTGVYRHGPVEAEKGLKIPGLSYNVSSFDGPRDAISVLRKRLRMPPLAPIEVPILDGLKKAHKYQETGISWLVAHLGEEHGALLADDMGLGKTMQTCLTWHSLGQPSLIVVCPASVRLGWAREMKRWTGVEPLVVDTGESWSQYDPMVPVVTSYKLAQKMPDHAFFDMMVVDEIQNARGRGAQQSRYLLDISKQAQFRLGLTGTPMWSRPNDLWMVLRILFPNYRFGDADSFDEAYCNAWRNRWGGKVNTGSSNEDELKHRLSFVMLRRTKQDVKTELPAVTRTVRYVEPTKKAKELLRMAVVGSRRMHDALAETLEAKLDTVVETVLETGSNALVFTWMKEHAYRLQTMLEKATKKEVLIITGDASHKQRDLIIQTARKTKQTVVATLDSCGVGVDGLQYVTSNVIYHALDYVPIKTTQSLARIDRLGQTEPVTATFVVMRESADDLVMSTIIDKLDQWMKVMGRDDNTAIRDMLVDGKSLDLMEEKALKAMYDAFGE